MAPRVCNLAAPVCRSLCIWWGNQWDQCLIQTDHVYAVTIISSWVDSLLTSYDVSASLPDDLLMSFGLMMFGKNQVKWHRCWWRSLVNWRQNVINWWRTDVTWRNFAFSLLSDGSSVTACASKSDAPAASILVLIRVNAFCRSLISDNFLKPKCDRSSCNRAWESSKIHVQCTHIHPWIILVKYHS